MIIFVASGLRHWQGRSDFLPEIYCTQARRPWQRLELSRLQVYYAKKAAANKVEGSLAHKFYS